jgi:hypothetical protein
MPGDQTKPHIAPRQQQVASILWLLEVECHRRPGRQLLQVLFDLGGGKPISDADLLRKLRSRVREPDYVPVKAEK